MSFVIYNTDTFKLLKARNGQESFPNERTAKTVRTKSKRLAKEGNADKWVVASRDAWQALDPMVETVNMLSGKKCMIRASEKGGCCDPATETYHSM